MSEFRQKMLEGAARARTAQKPKMSEHDVLTALKAVLKELHELKSLFSKDKVVGTNPVRFVIEELDEKGHVKSFRVDPL